MKNLLDRDRSTSLAGFRKTPGRCHSEEPKAVLNEVKEESRNAQREILRFAQNDNMLLSPILAKAEIPDALIIVLEALQDVLSAHLGEVQKAGIARDLVQRGHHELRIGEDLVVEIDLDPEQFSGKAQVVILGGVLEDRDVLRDASDLLEDFRQI